MKQGDLLVPQEDFWQRDIQFSSLIYTGNSKDDATGGWLNVWYEFLTGDKIVWVHEDSLEAHTWQVNGDNVGNR